MEAISGSFINPWRLGNRKVVYFSPFIRLHSGITSSLLSGIRPLKTKEVTRKVCTIATILFAFS